MKKMPRNVANTKKKGTNFLSSLFMLSKYIDPLFIHKLKI